MLALIVSFVFLVLALWHFYFALAGHSGESAGVPSVDGKPLFVPSKRATIAVGLVLVLFAILVAATAGYVPTGMPGQVLRWLSYGLALGLLALGPALRAPQFDGHGGMTLGDGDGR